MSFTVAAFRGTHVEARAMPEQFSILGGKVHVYKRPNSSL